jgi:hypothetical protein
MGIETFGKMCEKHTRLVRKIVYKQGTGFIEHSNAIDNVAEEVVEAPVLDADKLAQSAHKRMNAETTTGFTRAGGK